MKLITKFPLPSAGGDEGEGEILSVRITVYFSTPTFTLLNPRHAGFAGGEIQQGESSPVKGEEILLFSLYCCSKFQLSHCKIRVVGQPPTPL
jgi:hypothetical protein